MAQVNAIIRRVEIATSKASKDIPKKVLAKGINADEFTKVQQKSGITGTTPYCSGGVI